MTALLLAAALEASAARVVAISAPAVGSRQGIVVETASEWGAVAVRRDGPEVVVTLAGEADETLAVPIPAAPIEAIQLERTPGELRIHIRVASDVVYEVRRDNKKLTLLFATRPPVGISPASLDLYRSLFPPQADADITAGAAETSGGDDGFSGLNFGPLRLQPSLIVSYIDADTTITGPAPTRDQYYEIEPRLGAQLVFDFFNGNVRATYDPHFRLKSRVAEVNRPSHDADVIVKVPIGPSFTVGGNGHYTATTLQTSSADPGREYFFDLGRFTRTDVLGYAEWEIGPSFKTRVETSEGRVRFSEESAFFSYDQRHFGARLEYSMGESTKMQLNYSHDHTPPPAERPLVETTADTIGFDLSGELPMLIQGKVGVGLKDESAPRAVGDAAEFRGMVLSASLSKDLGRNLHAFLGGGRNTYLSAFENNAFYLSDSVNMAVDMRLPHGFFGRVGASYRRNTYRTQVEGLGESRRDDLYGWTAGFGRTLTHWSYLRADYGRERRDSNIDSLDSSGRLLIIQLGITPFTGGSGASAR